jgi:hypothetical protein
MTTNEKAMAVAGTDTAFRFALEPASLEAAYKVAAMAAKIQLCGVTTPEDALVRILTGRELGLTALQSMRLIYVVEGRPALDASLMLALSLNHPSCEYFDLVESSPERATYRACRRGREEVVLTWTLEQAKKAGLLDRGKDPTKNNWHRYPDAMLRARCVSALARIVFPEAIAGLYVREEFDDGEVPTSTNARAHELVAEVVTPSVPTRSATPQAAAARDFEAEGDVLKQKIIDAKTRDERKAVREEVVRWCADAGEPHADTLKRFYNMTAKAEAPAANGVPATATAAASPPTNAGDAWEAP